jgi:hypothetical protein
MQGCKKNIDNIKKIDYVYVNTTGHDLNLLVFNSDKNQIKTYSIPNGSQITSHKTESEGIGVFQFDESIDMIGDSVLLKFSENRCISYSRNNGVDIYGDNIFDYRKYDNYSEELVSGSNFTLIYTITVEDYNSSVECD